VQVDDCWLNDDAVEDEHSDDEEKEADEVGPGEPLPFESQ